MSAYTGNLFDLPPTLGATRPRPVRTGAPFARGSQTSLAAAQEVTPKLPAREAAVLSYVKGCGCSGATDAEIVAHFGKFHHWPESGTRPRRIKLRDIGLIMDSGEKRMTGTGSPATVWKARELE